MKEYGGYIEFESFRGAEYHENALALNSGRHCVEYLIRAKDIQKLYLPYFLCDSVAALCRKLGTAVEHYRISPSFEPLFDQTLGEGEWLYVVNYYGQLSEERLRALKQKHGRVIADYAQDFFRKPLEGVDTCYTCRKFFGVADGGYLYTDARLAAPLPPSYSYDKMTFLMGRFERTAEEFYAENVANNRRFAAEPLGAMSALTQNLMRGVDYERVRQTRTENFAFLHERLEAQNRLSLRVPAGAYMYPLYVENGAALRKVLQAKKIYIPTLWSSVLELCRAGDMEYELAQNILPLPVDQRYGPEDMQAILTNIR